VTAEVSSPPESALSARVPLHFAPGFSWRAVAAVMAEKFGLRGLRISLMIGVMIGYLWWRGCNGFLCIALYVFGAATILLAILITWTAKEALDKFVKEYQGNSFLTLDDAGIGGEAADGKTFKMAWADFRRVVERNGFWLIETKHKSWMVLPTTHFSSDAWAVMRAHRRQRA
jgi:hypothetical protein